MSDVVLVRADEVEFYVEVRDGARGPRYVRAGEAMGFDCVSDTIQKIAEELARAVKNVKPDEMAVEFGLSFSAQTGKLTGLLVDGTGGASLSVRLRWTA